MIRPVFGLCVVELLLNYCCSLLVNAESPGKHFGGNSENNMIRKLTIVMGLSSAKDYGGGEFQIIFPTKKVKTLKFNVGDVIMFPSTIPHRVRPVKWGRRISLVGWYGGPPFR